jgi:hypothetical protein
MTRPGDRETGMLLKMNRDFFAVTYSFSSHRIALITLVQCL